ncbi:gp53-like domain-containing protein [Desulfocurvibacter africanus]|uniref:Putative tail fiber protein gp53-like C-terminal domain-containing protein n=1 Tax=Desulfocurvibacter africanus subsp. africanus str. Walvis Bay TaxID=690850 RepID=F3Z2U4_DESAF|nr:tail fiber protein [Desulfocurvibacter africanus]EGJ50261.1 hypothetical protein Desaf_1932 [Desulfocurvibacter africanus subsp. africanus str. Walvis Bay]
MRYTPPVGAVDPGAPYVDGNPAAGIQGSAVPAAAIEHPQREIAAVIEAAGLTPDAEDLTQLQQAIQALGPDRYQGFAQNGTHDAYTGDLDAIARNSLYAIQQGVAAHTPADMPAGVLGFVQTMVHPGDAARTQLLWSVDDPEHPGWWRKRSGGTWGDWLPVGTGSGLPVGTVLWVPGTTPPPGMLAINDGASVSRASWPQLWEYAQTCGLLITEAEWQAQAAAQSSVGYFSDGDGATTFRLPRLRDYLRGADPSNGRAVGAWQSDAIRNITGTFGAGGDVGFSGSTPVGGAFKISNTARTNAPSPFSASSRDIAIDASLVVPTADENRPKSINWLPCIQAASVPVNAGTVDMLALASEVAGLEGSKVAFSDFTQSLTGNGWVKLPNGLILQWGIFTSNAGGNTVSFPIAFPNAVFRCVVTPGLGSFTVGIGSATKETVIIYTYDSATKAAVGGVNNNYYAIGY